MKARELQEAMDALSAGICYTDASGKQVYANAAMEAVCRDVTGKKPGADAQMRELTEQGYLNGSSGRVYLMERAEVITSRGNMTRYTARDATDLYTLEHKMEALEPQTSEAEEAESRLLAAQDEEYAARAALETRTGAYNRLEEALAQSRRYLKTGEGSVSDILDEYAACLRVLEAIEDKD